MHQGTVIVSTANTKEANKRKPRKKKKQTLALPVKSPVKVKAPVKKKPPGRKPGDKGRLEAHKGARERQDERALRAFDMRCAGWTIRAIAAELRCSASHTHDMIDSVRKELRSESLDLAAQEREMMLQQIDEAISFVIPHIKGSLTMETIKEGKKGPIVITVEEYEARMKACSALSRLVERKSKMLGADAPLKVEGVSAPAAPPAETLAKGRDVLKRWGVSFAPKGIVGAKVDE